ncbi:PREDICTED: uncharacterized protein LOC108520994 [Rhinopithecus bieti]|uniref:uncharacterized protein LOC108520994 n=1 Tax=Rhinopithecus bieti TaxID=61621 RepID=UPI00083C7867|nr:PREDICTED: uncharacterized protein LOC108520994 [Rhinopithecus bieti]
MSLHSFSWNTGSEAQQPPRTPWVHTSDLSAGMASLPRHPPRARASTGGVWMPPSPSRERQVHPGADSLMRKRKHREEKALVQGPCQTLGTGSHLAACSLCLSEQQGSVWDGYGGTGPWTCPWSCSASGKLASILQAKLQSCAGASVKMLNISRDKLEPEASELLTMKERSKHSGATVQGGQEKDSWLLGA